LNALEAWAIYAYIVLVAGVAGFTGAAAFQLAWAIKLRRRNGAARAAAVQSGTVTLQGNDQLKFTDGMAVQMSVGTGEGPLPGDEAARNMKQAAASAAARAQAWRDGRWRP
jgi:hypothetical protein